MRKLLNRCPKCGGAANHYLTTVDGDNLYQCQRGIADTVNAGIPSPCDTILDRFGRLFTGTVAYQSGDKIKALIINAGKVTA